MQKAIYTDGESETEVTFDDMEYQYIESVDHSIIYECRGYDAEGNIYSGIVDKTCDEYGSIEDIQLVESHNHKSMKELYDAEVKGGIYDPKNPDETLEEKMAKGRLLK